MPPAISHQHQLPYLFYSFLLLCAIVVDHAEHKVQGTATPHKWFQSHNLCVHLAMLSSYPEQRLALVG